MEKLLAIQRVPPMNPQFY